MNFLKEGDEREQIIFETSDKNKESFLRETHTHEEAQFKNTNVFFFKQQQKERTSQRKDMRQKSGFAVAFWGGILFKPRP